MRANVFEDARLFTDWVNQMGQTHGTKFGVRHVMAFNKFIIVIWEVL